MSKRLSQLPKRTEVSPVPEVGNVNFVATYGTDPYTKSINVPGSDILDISEANLNTHINTTATSSQGGHVKLGTDAMVSSPYALVGKNSVGALVVGMANMNNLGCIKKSSASGTSIPCIGVTNEGAAVLNVRATHSGFEKEGNTIYVQTSTNDHPANGAATTAPVATDTAGKLSVPPATTAKAGGVLLATSETDSRVNAVPTIAQFKALMDRVAALENA